MGIMFNIISSFKIIIYLSQGCHMDVPTVSRMTLIIVNIIENTSIGGER